MAIARSLDPLSVPIHVDRAYILHYYGKNDEALRSVKLALEMNPKVAMGYFWLGRIYTAQGRYQDAHAALQSIGPLRTWTPGMAAIGYLYGKSGRTREARSVLSEFDNLVRQDRYASAYAIAAIHAGLGDRERVFASLEAALRERSHWLVWLKRDPRWNDVRTIPGSKLWFEESAFHHELQSSPTSRALLITSGGPCGRPAGSSQTRHEMPD